MKVSYAKRIMMKRATSKVRGVIRERVHMSQLQSPSGEVPGRDLCIESRVLPQEAGLTYKL